MLPISSSRAIRDIDKVDKFLRITQEGLFQVVVEFVSLCVEAFGMAIVLPYKVSFGPLIQRHRVDNIKRNVHVSRGGFSKSQCSIVFFFVAAYLGVKCSKVVMNVVTESQLHPSVTSFLFHIQVGQLENQNVGVDVEQEFMLIAFCAFRCRHSDSIAHAYCLCAMEAIL